MALFRNEASPCLVPGGGEMLQAWAMGCSLAPGSRAGVTEAELERSHGGQWGIPAGVPG